MMNINWDEYVPESDDEYDICLLCKSNYEHTVEEHKMSVERERKRIIRREEALYKHAKAVYNEEIREP